MNQNLCYNCGGKFSESGRRICLRCGAPSPEGNSGEENALLSAAYRKLRQGDFAEAERKFEEIIRQYPKNAWGCWGHLLAVHHVKYTAGADGTYAPVCYAAPAESVSCSEDYQMTLAHAEGESQPFFRGQAEQIELCRKEWRRKLAKEKPYDIFICCKESARDQNMGASTLYTYLSDAGYRVFYRRKSLNRKAGESAEPYVFHALAEARILLVVGTKPEYLRSAWMKNEWMYYQKQIGTDEKKRDSLIVVCDGISPADLPQELADAPRTDANASGFYADLTERISSLLRGDISAQDAADPQEEIPEDAAYPSAAPITDNAPASDNAARTDEDDLCRHVPTIIPGKAPTCKESGWTESSVCTLCGKTLKKLEWIPPTDHVFGEWHVAKEATCTEDGEEESLCACGERKTRKIPLTGHIFGEWHVAKKATCTEDGTYERVCACGAKETQTIPSRGGHITTGVWETVREASVGIDGLKVKTCIICGAYAEEEKIPAIPSKGLKYAVNADRKTCTVTGMGSCKDSRLGIPATIDGYTVTAIGYNAFYWIDDLRYVSIPDTVKTIGGSAFWLCKNLTGVSIPSSVTVISDNAFYSCRALASITIPDSVTSIGSCAFQNCESLKSIVIPDSVKCIASSAFRGCTALTEVKLPNTVTAIGANAFAGCASLKNIRIPSSVTSIGEGAFAHCTALKGISVPYSVREVGNNAFSGCVSLTSVSLPSTLTGMSNGMFSGCVSLKSIVVPIAAVSIGEDALADCVGLTAISLPNSIKHIGKFAFLNCKKLRTVTLSSSLTTVGEGAFLGCAALKTLALPKAVKTVGDRAFSDCVNLFEVSLSDSVIAIGKNAFSNCKGLKSLSCAGAPVSIDSEAFSDCCGLTDVKLGSATRIGEGAFRGCLGISSITVPESVTAIGAGAFAGCSGLTAFRYGGTKSKWKKISLDKEWRKNSPIRAIECNNGTVKFLFS